MILYCLNLTGNLEETSGEQYLNQWIRPHFWFVVYADSHTCTTTTPPYVEGVAYEMIFLNPDTYGNASDHFGDDLRGNRYSRHISNSTPLKGK